MNRKSPRPFHGNISFNAQHSPLGAHFSFTCGHFGSRGGLGLQIGKPANQDIYIGVKNGPRFGPADLKCLPFFQGAASSEAARYDVEGRSSNRKTSLTAYSADQIKRCYGWASDRWQTDDFDFAIYTPFFPVPQPHHNSVTQLSILPAVIAEMTIDNTRGTQEKTAVFALRFVDPGGRLLDTGPATSGFAWRDQMGCRAMVGEGSARIENFQGLEPDTAITQPNLTHRLGACAGVVISVPARQRAVIRFALGAYHAGKATTGLEGQYRYTRAWGSLEMVLEQALVRFDQLKEQALLQDDQLERSPLSDDQKFLIAHATRSYHGSTELLDVGGEPFWIVNEGEYCMLNTLDLSVDHVFWELQQHPWLVRNLLDNFVRHYSYIDQVKVPKRAMKNEHVLGKDEPDVPRTLGRARPMSDFHLRPGGISFCHDMGINNNFSPRGNSSYETSDLVGCFSYMTAEQLCNWSLMAACYVHKTGDIDWLLHNQPIIESCLVSMLNRGGETGFCQYDSSRCQTGSEITTYDSLDHSLAQTRNNVYMAIKAWATYLGLNQLLTRLNNPRSKEALQAAARVEKTVLQNVGKNGVLPAVFEKDNPGYHYRILPAVEGLIYPWFWQDPILKKSTKLISALRRHVRELLLSGSNLFADGGIKLSSTSDNSWMSKVAIFVHVSRHVLDLEVDPAIREIFKKADQAHTRWQTEGESAYWACSDQMINGVARGSKYYPRIITSALWLNQKSPAASK